MIRMLDRKMKNFTEEEYNKSSIRETVDSTAKMLAIDLSKWYFGGALEGDDWFNVFHNNIKMENHCLNIEFYKVKEEWILERFEVIQD